MQRYDATNVRNQHSCSTAECLSLMQTGCSAVPPPS
jgi:hypothetical protein